MGHVERAHAVDERVVGLRRDRPAPVLEPGHQLRVPEWAPPVKSLRPVPGRPFEQLVPGPGCGQLRAADVLGDVEGRIGVPGRPAQSARVRLGQPAAVAGQRVDALVEVPAQRVEGGGEARAGLEDHDGPDVHVGRLVCLLEFQERRVQRGEPFAGHGGNAPARRRFRHPQAAPTRLGVKYGMRAAVGRPLGITIEIALAKPAPVDAGPRVAGPHGLACMTVAESDPAGL